MRSANDFLFTIIQAHDKIAYISKALIPHVPNFYESLLSLHGEYSEVKTNVMRPFIHIVWRLLCVPGTSVG